MTRRRVSVEDYDIYPVLENYGWTVPHSTTGWQRIRCIEHDDSHASASVNSDNNHVVCLACGFKADTFGLVMHYEGLEFLDAVNRTEEILNGVGVHVRQTDRRSGGVSIRSRDRSSKRSYTPPRHRNRT